MAPAASAADLPACPVARAQAVAARWGVPLAPGVAVRVVPQGTSGLPLPVWDAATRTLTFVPGGWRGGRESALSAKAPKAAPAA
ncbi:MAG TPA: hypothetical protein PKE47_01935, partial [Verrucomicrobiota bacterium]|nr:hypothetical protein [Verrucomicrobiota bacterium]